MVTRCPACATLFRVTPQQLQAREGRVRCGRCMKVFDGFKSLATPPENVRSPVVVPETAPARDENIALRVRDPAVAPAGERAPDTAPEETRESSRSSALQATPAREERASAAPPMARAADAADAPAERAVPKPEARPASTLTSPPVSADALFLEQAHAKRRGKSWFWTVGSVFLALGLALQAAYFYRGELAANYRTLKPIIMQACELLACAVPLPQRPGLINIEASDLQSVDPARPGLIEFTATLRNHAGYDIAYPALDLVLTNTKEHTLARRIFLPHEYLDPSRHVAAGFPANAEVTVRLDLDTGQLGAAGFRLGLLAAPAR